MRQKIIDLYDEYAHGGMNRRDFLDRLATLAGRGTAPAECDTIIVYDIRPIGIRFKGATF